MLKRSVLIAVLSVIGALLFLPFMFADVPKATIPSLAWSAFPTAVAIASLGLAALGLRWSDNLWLPMPVLRGSETRTPVDWSVALGVLAVAATTGAVLGVAGLAVVKLLGVPANPGTALVRAASTLFAAVVTETVAHLFLFSGFLMLWRRSSVPALIVSIAAFVAIFHGQTPGLDPAFSAALLGMNFVMALAFGLMPVKAGFETAVLTHAVAHLILLSFG